MKIDTDVDADSDWVSKWYEVKGPQSFQVLFGSVAGTPLAEFSVEVSNTPAASGVELTGSRTTMDEGDGELMIRMPDEKTYTYARLRYEHNSANAGQFSVYAHGLYNREIAAGS